MSVSSAAATRAAACYIPPVNTRGPKHKAFRLHSAFVTGAISAAASNCPAASPQVLLHTCLPYLYLHYPEKTDAPEFDGLCYDLVSYMT